MTAGKKAVFFDRDGVVNFRPVEGYITSPSEFSFIPDFLRFFVKVKKLGFLCILISNQQGVGKGLMSETDLKQVDDFMQSQLLSNTGFMFDETYYCTDLRSANSPRRKPEPGMLLDAINKWNISPVDSWMFGDSETDIIAGNSAGTHTVLLRSSFLPPVATLADLVLNNFDDFYLL